MVFKKPGNSRDDRPKQSSGRRSGGADSSKKSFSASRGKSAAGSDRPDSKRPSKSYGEKSGEKKSFSPREGKPYAGKSDGDYKSSFTGGEKKSFSPRKPYSGRPADSDDRPKRSFGSDAPGEKKSFSSSRSKPYSGRVSSADSSERPKRSPDNYRGSNDTPGDKKPFSSSRSKPYSGRTASDDDRPKRSSDSTGDRKFSPAGSKPRTSAGDKKFGDRPSAGGFKKREEGSEPFRKSPKSSYNKITPDRDAPVKTLRGRKEKENKDSGLIRLNRYIANAGICSRRKADDLIAAGVVSVNGEVINELGHKIDPMKDEIRYNGELLKREKMVYVLLNKPKDYITTTDDPQERRTVMHLVEKASRERIYPIGRLDRNTTGLLLMTNDGDLADKLSHPRSNITKLYQVELNKSLAQGDMNKIGFGLELEDGLIKPDSISYVQGASKKEIGIQIHSGKNRIVRRIFEHLGYEVVKLDRVVYAGLTKKDLTRGRWRYLDEKEIIMLKHLI
jgi:23S rRNA pseudouridine2605 synthase